MLYNQLDATPASLEGSWRTPEPRRVSDILREGFDGFSRSQKAVARYIIDHLEEVGYLSAEELGQKGNTSSSTVVRFAQSLGFAGYPELQKAARDEYRLGATARPVVHDDQLGFSIEEDVLTRSLKTDVLSLEETISKNTRRPLQSFGEDARGGPAGTGRRYARGGRRGRAHRVRSGAPRHPVPGRHRQLRSRMWPDSAGWAARTCSWRSGFRRAHSVTISFAEKAARRASTSL